MLIYILNLTIKVAKSLNPAKQSILSMILEKQLIMLLNMHATEVIGELKVHEHQIILKLKIMVWE